MTETIRLGEIAGVRIGVNWSVIVIFLLITFGLAAGRFPMLYPDLPSGAYVAAGLAAGLVFLLSLLAHEVSHTIVALRNGVPVESITLWLLGGVARMSGDASTPGAAIRIAAVGPAVSLVLAAVFAATALVVQALGFSGLGPGVFWWLALINALLAVFNLIPAGPLDGGRVLRGFLWMRSGERYGSAITAARIGQGFGWFLIAFGIASFLAVGFGGLWLALIGWFLTFMARAEEDQAQANQLLGGVRVRDVMTPDPSSVGRTLSVRDLLDKHILTNRYSTFPVVDSFGRMDGLVTLNRIKQVPADRQDDTTVGDVACPPEEVATAAPDDELVDLMPRMSGCPDGRALVLEGDRVVGIVSPRDVAHRIEIAQLRQGDRERI
jgi:Zn-dependent protease/CBS domain-containing protein